MSRKVRVHILADDIEPELAADTVIYAERGAAAGLSPDEVAEDLRAQGLVPAEYPLFVSEVDGLLTIVIGA